MTVSRTTRSWLIGLAVAFTLLLVAGGALSVASGLARQKDTVTQTVNDPPTRLDAHSSAGDVHVVAADRKDVRIVWRLTWSFQRPELEVRRDGDVLVLRERCGGFGINCGVDITVEVPAATRVVATSNAGDVTATGLTTNARLQTSAGDVRGEQLRSPELDAKSAAGDVRLAFTASPMRVSARSSAGDVTVVVPDERDVAYFVDASSSAGNRQVAVDTDRQSTRTISVDSAAGDVAVRYP